MSDLAKRLIAENKRTRATFLDLGRCGLTSVPEEIAELVWLESMSLADEWFEWRDGVWNRRVSQNQEGSNHFLRDVQSISGLGLLQSIYLTGTTITTLAPLTDLANLQTLDLRDTPVKDLSPLANLVGLRALELSHAEVTDLAPIVNLAGLQRLDLAHTPVTDLTPLATLVGLQVLNLTGTQVIDLAPLTNLASLERLILMATQVTNLSPLEALMRRGIPVRLSSDTWKGPGIYIQNCPLTNPPLEIAKYGNEAILNYFDERRLGLIDHLYEAKMLILGEGGAGKTSLLRRLYQQDQPLPTESETTRGIAIHHHEFPLRNGRTFRLNVWDFAGQEIYHATHQFFLTHRSLYLLVDDTRKDYKSVSDEGFKYWLDLIDVFGGHSPVLIFQNEKGGRSKVIDLAGIKGRYDNVKEKYSGDLQRADSVTTLREAIEFFAGNLSHIGEELPAKWIQVRKDIEVRAARKPHITQQEYFDIYATHLEFDRTKALHLSRYLHDLGVLLHFQGDPLLCRTVILQNTWATEAVFRVLDDEAVKAKLGRFDEADCRRLWKDSFYSDMHLELLALMKNFELCYEVRDSNPTTWLAPQLLQPTKPDVLAVWAKPDDLRLRYRYDFLPKGLIGRLTVRQHRFVRRPDLSWTNSVLFEHDSTSLLVESLAGSEIELRARGPERKGLLDIVSADLDALNESYPGLRDKVHKRIPCDCKLCATQSVPHFFDYGEMLRRKEHNRLTVECPLSFEVMNVLELLDGWTKGDSADITHIFLASSAELRDDRDAFELYVLQQNHHFRRRNIYFEVIRWENFVDAMSETRLQDEYNNSIKSSDLFVSLFFTKTGQRTEEEFDTAHQQFKTTGKPKIYTYFKDANISTAGIAPAIVSLLNFKEKLSNLGHYPTTYTSTEHLKRHFGEQLEMLYPPSRP